MPDKQPPQKTFRLEDFPKKLLRSFMPAAYPQLASEEPSASALYLAGVAFLVVLLLLPVFYTIHEDFYERRVAAIRADFPENLYYENGEALYDGEQPYVHVDQEGDQRYAVIIDTTGQTTAIPDEYDVGMLITKTTIIYKGRGPDNRTVTHENPIPSTPGRISARQFSMDALAKRKWPDFAVTVGHFFFLFTALPAFVLAALAAAIAFALATGGKGTRLPFRTCFNIAAHAATPAVFIAASWLAAGTLTQFVLLVGVPLLLFILLATFGTRACLRAQEAT